jgi:hypothetical protein
VPAALRPVPHGQSRGISSRLLLLPRSDALMCRLQIVVVVVVLVVVVVESRSSARPLELLVPGAQILEPLLLQLVSGAQQHR